MMAIVHIDFRTISWGGPNEDDSNNVWQVEDGSNDPGEIVLQDFGTVGAPVNGSPTPPTTNNNAFSFVFWNATDGVSALDGYPSTGAKLNLPSMGGVVHATAWYTAPGGVGGGPPALRGRTFDVDLNNFRKETPIHSANPANAWSGPNRHSASTEGAAGAATPR